MITFNKISDGWPESHEMPRWQDASKLSISEATLKYKLCRFLHLHTEQFDGLLAIFTKLNVRRFRSRMLYYRLFVSSIHNTSKFYRLTQMTAAGALVLMELLCAWDNETLYPACNNADLCHSTPEHIIKHIMTLINIVINISIIYKTELIMSLLTVKCEEKTNRHKLRLFSRNIQVNWLPPFFPNPIILSGQAKTFHILPDMTSSNLPQTSPLPSTI